MEITEERLVTILGFLFWGTGVEIVDERVGKGSQAAYECTMRFTQEGVSNTFILYSDELVFLAYHDIIDLDSGSGDEFTEVERRVYILTEEARIHLREIVRTRNLPLQLGV